MPPRRFILASGSVAAASCLVAACLSWSVASPRLTDFLDRELRRSYGVALSAEGSTVIALLPMPRVKIVSARLSAGSRAGPTLAEGGALTIQLNLTGLLMGRVEMNALSLDGASVASPASARWAGPAQRLVGRLSEAGASHPRRLTISRATIVDSDGPDGAGALARDADLSLSWPLWSPKLDAAGGFTWKGAATRFAVSGVRPSELLAGVDSTFAAAVSWPAGSLAVSGRGRFGEDGPVLSGSGGAQTRSLPETLAWLGGGVALSPLVEGLAVEGAFAASRDGMRMPTLRVTAGGNVLDGAGSMTFGGARSAIQATLAAESLTLSPLLAGVVRRFGLDAPDDAERSSVSIALAPLTAGDLDLRLSAGSARIGPLVLDDVAASVLARHGGVEASLIRAAAKGGSVKGRMVMSASAADPAETEIKAQGAFERLDLGALLEDLGQPRWLFGPAQGQFSLESKARDSGDLAGRVSGRAALAVESGAIAGLDLADVAHRNGSVARGALARRNGRTGFSRASMTLRFADGVGEIADGSLAASTVDASLRGTVSLPERSVRALAELRSRSLAGDGSRRPSISFEIVGPWIEVSARVTPDHQNGHQEAGPDPLPAPASIGLPAAARAYSP